MNVKQVKTGREPLPMSRIIRNVKYGVAVGLTKTAKDAQKTVQDTIKGTFTVRSNWTAQSGKYGIRTKPATREDLKAEVRTNADWLLKHEEGGIHKPARSKVLAIPTENIRKTPMQKIAKRMRPRNLLRTFVIDTAKGPVLFQRKFKGKRSKIAAVYGLEREVKIKKNSVFYEPAEKAVKRRIHTHIRREVATALATAR